MTTTMIFAISAVAQKIDFDMANRQPSEVTADGYTSWMVAQGTTDSKTVDGITITISASGNANMLRSQWSKNDVKTRGLKLTGDGVAALTNTIGGWTRKTVLVISRKEPYGRSAPAALLFRKPKVMENMPLVDAGEMSIT